MKELTIEQKAKAYDEAIKRGLDYIRHTPATEMVTRQDIFEAIFPELRESEGERIRKFLHHTFTAQYLAQDKLGKWHGEPVSNILAWLEKQGESDETKAKTFIINKGYPIDANGIFPTYEEMYNIIKEGLEKQGKQQESAKEYTFKAIPRLLEMLQPTDRAKSYCQKLIDSLEQEGYSTDARIVRERLKIMEGETVAMATMDEQKPAEWSDDDERKYNRIYDIIHNAAFSNYEVDEDGKECGEYAKIIEWFNSLKDRVLPQPKQELSEQDEIAINAITQLMKTNEKYNVWKSVYMYDENVEVKFEYIASWLKSIKDRLKQQPKQEWSEEDERILLRLIAHFDWHGDTRFTKEDCQEATNWLKSLRPNHWKPSEEQKGALNEIINTLAVSKNPHENDYLFNMLNGLRTNLKKL